MRYLPKSESERREMLDACGLESIEDLFSHLPEEVRLNRPLNIAPGKSEYEIVDYFRARGDENAHRLRIVSRRGRVQPLPAGDGGHGRVARRVSDFVHAVSGRDRARHSDHDLRIPNHDLPVDRHGRRERVDVRRLVRRARSGHDGRARHRPRPRSGRADRASGISRSAADLRAAPGHAGR